MSLSINVLNEQKIRPGEFVMRVLFTEFTSQAEKKINAVMLENPERSLSKSLQRGEDPSFDQLLLSFGSVAEHCLPSILKTLFAWYDRQVVTWLGNHISSGSGSVSSSTGSSISSGIESMDKEQLSILSKEPAVISERRDLAVEFIFCLVLIEVLKQLSFHPGHLDLISKIEDLAFVHFKYREGSGVNASNALMIADLYAEVLGVMAQARFSSVRLRFLSELTDLRMKESNAANTQAIISLLMGMKFFRIKMAPIEDFELSFQFLTECAKYFLDVKQRDIKHALAGLFVEILVPVAATVKHEVNVPCLKSFVEMLYTPTLDMCARSKHRLALFPLVTCLLCVSQRTFFLHNWHYFLAMCLSQLKSREPKMSRVALESLYRLLWAYMIRIKCESNSATQSRLLSIVNSLFPKGSKGVVPRDTPLNIFVKIIQFIAQERLDFAMREIIFELLSVGRPIKIILTPERMNIGLRAFLVIADSLQQKDGDPPMPRSMGIMPSGNTLLRVKKTYLNKVLTEDTARSIGMASYFPLIKKVFTDILRALDQQCGRSLMLTAIKDQQQEESILTGESKAKIDLFRTCVAGIPRLIPDGMTRAELLQLLSRLTLHIDEELRVQAFQSLQSLLIDLPDWRNDVLAEFLNFVSKDVPDTCPQQLDNSLRMLHQLLTSWRNSIGTNATNKQATTIAPAMLDLSTTTRMHNNQLQIKYKEPQNPVTIIPPNLSTFYQTEGLGLLMLCSVKSSTRRIGVHILKEIKGLSETLQLSEISVIDVIDQICPSSVEKIQNILPPGEKQAVCSALSSNTLDILWLTDRTCQVWYITEDEEQNGTNSTANSLSSSLGLLQSSSISLSSSTSHCPATTDVSIKNDPWALCLVDFLDYQNIPTQCPRAIFEAWSILMPKLTSLYNYIEPSPVADNRASILRSAGNPRKPPTDRSLYLKLWRNYLLFAFRTIPPNVGSSYRSISPDMAISSSPEAHDRHEGRSPVPPPPSIHYNVNPVNLYKMIIPLIRSEVGDIRDLAVLSLSFTNYMIIKDVFEELNIFLKESCDRKQENVRRRKRKDNLRLQIVKIIEMISIEKTFGRLGSYWMSQMTVSSSDHRHHDLTGDRAFSLPTSLLEFFESCKGWLENDTDREGGIDIRISFCTGIFSLIRSFEIELKENLLKREIRKNLFSLCIGWAGPYSQSYWNKESSSLGGSSNTINIIPLDGCQQHLLEFVALKAAISLLTCGPCYQPELLSDESNLYTWIEYLLLSEDESVAELAEEMVIMLLEFNPDIGSILDWAVGRCFTGSPKISDACFRAIAILFSAREYPCDRYVAIINVALLYCGSAKFSLQNTAFQLLQVLDKRFFTAIPSFNNDGSNREQLQATLNSALGRIYFAKSQTYTSKQLSLIHPELTMPIFSEISWRMISARSDVRQSLLAYLQPWLHNMELVEPTIPSPNVITSLSTLVGSEGLGGCRYSISSSSLCSLCEKKYPEESDFTYIRRGWGSREVTEMVLNNLFYLTAKFGELHNREIEECWQTLCCSSPNNQRVVLYYLLIVTGLSNEILPHSKRVLIYLFRARPVKLLEDLMAELQTVESLNWLVERTETPPFYRLTHLSLRQASYSEITNSSMHNNVNSSTNGTSRESATRDVNRLNLDLSTELEKGTIHTKRRSAEETVFQPPQPPHLRSSSSGAAAHFFKTGKTRTISGPAALPDTEFINSERERIRASLYNDDGDSLIKGEIKEFNESSEKYPSDETLAANGSCGKGDINETPSIACNFNQSTDEEKQQSRLPKKETSSQNYGHSHNLLPLPMPEYGGYYAPLKEFFPSQPVSPFHRCNLALMFVCELINEGSVLTIKCDTESDEDSTSIAVKCEKRIDWCSHFLPLMIHMGFLGMDNIRPLVPAHCFTLIINLLTVAGAHQNYLAISQTVLNQQAKELNMGLLLPSVPIKMLNFLDINLDLANKIIEKYDHHTPTPTCVSEKGDSPTPIKSSLKHHRHQSSLDLHRRTSPISISPKSSPLSHSKRGHSSSSLLFTSPDLHHHDFNCNLSESSGSKRDEEERLTYEQLTLSFIKFFTERKQNASPLWPCEDITARLWNIRSATCISALVQNSLGIFLNSFPSSNLEHRWSAISLQIGLACSSRHYAGRSLEIYRALKVPLTTRVLCDILSRLVETVAEPGDDMQGYVTELILTLGSCIEAFVDHDNNMNSQDLTNCDDLIIKNEMIDTKVVKKKRHEKIDSYERKELEITASTYTITPEMGCRDSPPLQPQMRARSGTGTFGNEPIKRPVDLTRSKSVQSLSGLKNEDYRNGIDLEEMQNQENEVDVIPQVFWLSLSLCESDYEYEYLLALRLLEKVMDRQPLENIECRDKIERVQVQLQWNSFPGIIHLLLKGFTNPNTYEQSLTLLSRFIPFLDFHFVDPSGEAGFPLTVMAFLPYLLAHYDDPTPLCLTGAQLIAEAGNQKGEDGCQALKNLATVMSLYFRRSFSKDCVQWLKCVVKYLYDSYTSISPLLLGFLLDVLEKGPASIHVHVMSSLNCFFNYVDLTNIGAVSPELLKAIEKHLDMILIPGQYSKESLRILKLVVSRSSSLVVPNEGSSGPTSLSGWDSVSSSSSSAFSSDIEFSGNLKKELPGRTMEFSFDVSQTPIIGRRHVNTSGGITIREENTRLGNLTAQRSGSIGEIGWGQAMSSAWKRPWQSQSRVRECLVSLLNACGQRVGLPKSPSVIFSQSSELMERLSSVASSTEEVSAAINDTSGGSRIEDGSTDAHFRVFRDFDFLEYELEDIEGESNDNFNWGVRRRPLSEFGDHENEGEIDNESSILAHSLSHSEGGVSSTSNDSQNRKEKRQTAENSAHDEEEISNETYGMDLMERVDDLMHHRDGEMVDLESESEDHDQEENENEGEATEEIEVDVEAEAETETDGDEYNFKLLFL